MHDAACEASRSGDLSQGNSDNADERGGFKPREREISKLDLETAESSRMWFTKTCAGFRGHVPRNETTNQETVRSRDISIN